MKKTFLLQTAIFFLVGIAVIGIFCVPSEDNSYWLEVFCLTKAIGLSAAYIAFRLVSRPASPKSNRNF